MIPSGYAFRLAVALWLALLVAGLVLRPPLPVDETRYLTVAWEMRQGGHWLVPHLNGATYAHKPPLLFWSINLVWTIFGVGEWSARLVAPLFAAASLALLLPIARLLWPDRPAIGPRAALILSGTALWAVFSSLTMFDAIMGFWTLLGLLGLLNLGARPLRGALILGAALGAGVLTKGPVILVYLLPVAILAPLLHPLTDWRTHAGGVLLSVALSVAIALTWALPAAERGGPAFAGELLLDQTAGRMVESFAHRRPAWWYLPLLPLLLAPWVFVPALWRGLRDAGGRGDRAVRWLAAGALASLLAFSAISGKQAHYLLPLLPLMALVAARLLDDGAWREGRPIAFAAAAVPALLVAGQLVAAPWLAPRYDVRPMAERIKAMERAGQPYAWLGRHHGQFGFAGRLEKPVPELTAETAPAWIAANPDGVLVRAVDGKRLAEFEGVPLLERRPWRGRWMIALAASDVAARPDLLR